MTDASRLAAALSDRYRIERELGAGGMATVYLARDLRHERDVALKVLRPELAAIIGAERFLAEIRTTANLQHPHILPLFDSGEADSFLFYVMPYVAGESLRDRLNREKQLPIAEALRIATGVASALDYAHRNGVVHRDIKPENILLHDGQPLVADFGIALALSSAGGTRMTETGMSVGTPTYMSPEQAMGERDIDARADIYSLGCVVYEMLSGDPPFTGSTAQAIAARVLTETPRSLTKQRHTIPPHVEAAVLTALEKLPADRFATAQAFADALEGKAGVTPAAVRGMRRAAPARGWQARLRDPVVWALAVAAVVASGVAFLQRTDSRSLDGGSVVRFTVSLPAGYRPSLSNTNGPDLDISPDGSTVVFPVIDARGGDRLYVRRMDEATARPLPGTDRAYVPRFSADGASVEFFAAGRFEKVALSGGAPLVVTEVGSLIVGSTWAPDGDIFFATPASPVLMRVSGAGGRARAAASLDTARGETLQLFPRALPDGRHVLYLSWGHGGTEDARIGLLNLSTGRTRRLDVAGTFPLGMLDGKLIYADQTGTVLAVPLDIASGTVSGQPVPLLTGVATSARGSAVAALSPTGTLTYDGGGRDATLELANAAGATPLLPDVRAYSTPRYSPDGKTVAVSVASGTSSDIWLGDVASGSLTRLTSGAAVNERPEWSPDGSRVIFRTVHGGRSALWWQPANGSSPASPLLADSNADYFEGVMTPDGRSLVFQVDTGQSDIMVRNLEGRGPDRPLAATPAQEDHPRVSPDGRWVAYVKDDGSGPQVVVQSISGVGARVQVSVRGGDEPVWSPDGRRIFYRNEGKFIVAEVAATPTFHVVSQADFMDDTYLPSPVPHANFDVSPDGKSLLVVKGEPEQFMVVHDWAAEVRTKLAGAEKR